MRHVLLAIACLITFVPHTAIAASQQDIDDMSSYAVILGRAIGCGMSVEDETRKVGKWMDRVFPNDEKKMYLMLFAAGMKHHAEQQASGQSPDSCNQIRSVMSKTLWP